MGINTGNQAKLQIGQQANWSTAVSPTFAIEFTKEALRYIPQYIESDALVGQRTTGRMDVVGVKVEGDFSMIVTPDNIGLLLAMALGAEASPAAVDGSAVYDHVFTPISAVAASSLPEMTIVVDRLTAVYGYVGCKVDSMVLESRPKDYLRATFAVRGYDEASDATETLSYSTRIPFQFTHCALTVDAATFDEVTGFRLNYRNNLEDDLFVMNGSTKMIEIEPQKRDISMDIDVLFNSDTDTYRTSKFKAGATAAVIATFTSTEEVLTGKYYTLTISCPLAYITDCSPAVGGPDRLKCTLALKAAEDSTHVVCTITLRDGRSTKYST